MTGVTLTAWRPSGEMRLPVKMVHNDVTSVDGDKLFPAFVKAMNAINGTDIGKAMLKEIQQSPNKIEIIAAGAGVDSKCQIEGSEADKACYPAVLSDQALCDAMQDVLDGAGSVTKAVEKFKPALDKFQKYADTPCIATGVKTWKVPKAKLDSQKRGKIAYYMRDALKPGPGVSKATVVWNIKVDDLRSLEGYKDASWAWRPIWVSLAHELIHAWRYITGRAVFHPALDSGTSDKNYYEEAMTVGLPPYDGCRFTENKFRLLMAEPMRDWYGPDTHVKSVRAAQKHGGVFDRTFDGYMSDP